MKRLIATLALATVALAAAACAPSNATTGTPAPTVAVDPSSPPVIAKDMKFQTPNVTAPAGKAFAMTFENQDSQPHNVSIYTDSSAPSGCTRARSSRPALVSTRCRRSPRARTSSGVTCTRT